MYEQLPLHVKKVASVPLLCCGPGKLWNLTDRLKCFLSRDFLKFPERALLTRLVSFCAVAQSVATWVSP